MQGPDMGDTCGVEGRSPIPEPALAAAPVRAAPAPAQSSAREGPGGPSAGSGLCSWDLDIRTPAVKDLEALDEELLQLERRHEAECLSLRRRYERQWIDITERRREVLLRPDPGSSSPDAPTATPGLPGFWRLVLQNSAEFQEDIERHDEPVLDHLVDIRTASLDQDSADTGFRITFVFEPNPFFSNLVLEKVYRTERRSRFANRLQCMKIESSKIEWKSGRNVTVELISKKAKSSARRRTRPRKEEVWRPSFFRSCFRNLGPDEVVPEEEIEDSDMDNCMDLMDCLMEDDFEQGLALRDYIIPHAIRWYTGEACEDEEEDGEEEEEEQGSDSECAEDSEDEDDDEDDDDDETEEEEAGGRPRGRNGSASATAARMAQPPRKNVKGRK